jgi:hypothetical protein
MNDWMKQEGVLDPTAVLDEEPVQRRGANRARTEAPTNLAVYLKPVVVLNTQKWFGEAELRMDIIVVHGGSGDVADLYHPTTLRFPRVKDGNDLAATAGERGILVYLGQPAHFLAMSILLARDTSDSDTLADMIKKEGQSNDVKTAFSGLAGVLTTVPHAAAVQAGVAAALTFGDIAYRLVRRASPKCLGLYRAAWLANRDHFGEGTHPTRGVTEVNDFRFAYQIVRDEKEGAKGERP